MGEKTHSQVSLCASTLQASRQSSANFLGEGMFATGARNFAIRHGIGSDILRCLAQSLPFKFDGHGRR